MTKKIYISGYISGGGKLLSNTELEYCRAKFQKAEDRLRLLGWEPVNPMKVVTEENPDYITALRTVVAAQADCSAVYFLDDWSYSKGALAEHVIAGILKQNKYYEGTLNDAPHLINK